MVESATSKNSASCSLVAPKMQNLRASLQYSGLKPLAGPRFPMMPIPRFNRDESRRG